MKLLIIFLLIITISIYSKKNIICTEDESNKLASLFVHNGHINSFNRKIYDGSNCPTEGWFEAMRDSDVQSKSSGIFINIGFNKGYNFANWMNLYTPWTKVTPLLWFDFLQKKYKMSDNDEPCGVCNDCHVTFKSSQVSINNNAGIMITSSLQYES
jgi:hypothetical protein